ncbi:unnamed protein product [Schistocephalus solidus]|uniref:Reverse transcriptase domain-containing protein n=1 Tax=Schistocephalus solidus TaxID=70667 RepID=A0A183S7Z0_SCHSO|nr:unnamed protein product [Schistocephalus solidus]
MQQKSHTEKEPMIIRCSLDRGAGSCCTMFSPGSEIHRKLQAKTRIPGTTNAPKKLENLHAPDDNATAKTLWSQMRSVMQSTALKVPGRARHQHQDWFDENDAVISNLLVDKNRFHEAYMEIRTDDTRLAFFRCRRLVRQWLREMQEACMVNYGPCVKRTPTLLSSDGTALLNEKVQILKRCVEYFRNGLNYSSVISNAAISRFPHMDMNNDLELPPSLLESVRTLQQSSSGKSPGYDAMPAEVYKHGVSRLMAELTTGDVVPRTIFLRFQRRDRRPSLQAKEEANILAVTAHRNQCGFQQHRGTTDMIFAAHQLQEKCQEMRTHLYTTFLNLMKAFGTVNHDGLWKIMQKVGCLERFTHIVRQFLPFR